MIRDPHGVENTWEEIIRTGLVPGMHKADSPLGYMHKLPRSWCYLLPEMNYSDPIHMHLASDCRRIVLGSEASGQSHMSKGAPEGVSLQCRREALIAAIFVAPWGAYIAEIYQKATSRKSRVTFLQCEKNKNVMIMGNEEGRGARALKGGFIIAMC